ncbi:hypothetical protein KI387_003321, partial [Taxus chinensis]
MWSYGTYPDHVSFIFVLLAFSHAGSVHEGCKYFDGMSASYRIMPRINHYVCMIDILGHAGMLKACEVFDKMPSKIMVSWLQDLRLCTKGGRSHSIQTTTIRNHLIMLNKWWVESR